MTRKLSLVAALFAAGLLSACTPSAPEPGADQAESRADVVASGAVCRIGPEGGPVVADRGIGGTGAPRLTQTATQIAERGTGGTGIVGVITGFASVCVDGLEVHYDATASVDIDGTAASVSALRVGQVVVIDAEGSAAAPQARTISVRRELAGRVESVELGTGTLTIAGQSVSVPAGTWGADRFGLGDWVTVSGLRREDGVVVASRMDPAAAGTLSARGQVVREGDVTRVGTMVLQGAIAQTVKPGQFVTVSGLYVAGQGQVNTVVPDTLFANPAAYFNRSVNRILVQAFVRVTNGSVSLNGLQVKAGPGVSRQAGAGGTSIVSLERRADGSFTAVGVRAADLRGQAGGSSGRARRGQTYVTVTPGSARRASTPVQPDDAPAAPVTGGPAAPASTDTDTGAGGSGTAATPAAATNSAATAPPVAASPVATSPVVESVSSASAATVATPVVTQNVSVNAMPVTAAVVATVAESPVASAVAVSGNTGSSATNVSSVAKVQTTVAVSDPVKVTGSVSHPTVGVVTSVVSPVIGKVGVSSSTDGGSHGQTTTTTAASTKTTTVGTKSGKSTSSSGSRQTGH